MAAKKGHAFSSPMSSEHRVKIQNSNILNALIEHACGDREMSATQVTAGLGLLKKVLPDLAAVELSGAVNMKRAEEMTDDELAAIAARGRAVGSGGEASETSLDPSQLN